MTDRMIQYPSRAEPLPVTEKLGWPAQISQPYLKRAYYAALIASGVVFSPEPIPNPVAPDVSSWAQPPSQPYFAKSHHAALAASGEVFDPNPIPTPPDIGGWGQPPSIPVRYPVGLKAYLQPFIAFVDIQPFINPADRDVYVKKYPYDEEYLREKGEKDLKRQLEEESSNRTDRREALFDAIYGPVPEYGYAGKPVIAKPKVDTTQLASMMLQAQQKKKMQAQQMLDAREEEELERLLLEL